MNEGASCADALLATCGVEPGDHGFCERSAGDTVTPLTCFTQADGSHLCDCPAADKLVASTETGATYSSPAAKYLQKLTYEVG